MTNDNTSRWLQCKPKYSILFATSVGVGNDQTYDIQITPRVIENAISFRYDNFINVGR